MGSWGVCRVQIQIQRAPAFGEGSDSVGPQVLVFVRGRWGSLKITAVRAGRGSSFFSQPIPRK